MHAAAHSKICSCNNMVCEQVVKGTLAHNGLVRTASTGKDQQRQPMHMAPEQGGKHVSMQQSWQSHCCKITYVTDGRKSPPRANGTISII